jgi:hypothetical protein
MQMQDDARVDRGMVMVQSPGKGLQPMNSGQDEN